MKISKKILAFLILCVIIISYQSQIFAAIENSTTGDVTSKKLYTLPSVKQIGIAGTNRGNYHDRQNLGIYMPAGSSFEIRNLSTETDLTLDCLNNDSDTENTFTIPKGGESWVTIKSDRNGVSYDSVPFIRTAYGLTTAPTVEIRNIQGTEELTYYYYKGNEQQFFEKWNSNNHSYAVIENDVATFLIPIKDRESIVKTNGGNYNFKSIDEMLEYYKDFVEQFDRFLGYSYNTDNPLNKNIRTKFFVKANKHGAGAAYYSGNHTAQNSDTMSAYLCKGWLNLHEFGHGYEGSLANQDLYLVDVMNNILAHYYQITYLNENDGGWLGKKINIEGRMKNARDTKNNFNDFEYAEKLYMFVDLLDKIGPEKAMGYVHSKYREYVSQGIQYNASDMFSKGFSEYSGYNVIPYLNSYKITPSIDIQAEIYEKELPMLYYLRDLVDSDEKAEELRQALGLDGKYAVVSNSDIAKYNMKGNLQINITIDDLEQIKGKKMYIKDGSKLIKEITIDSKEINVEGLPAGIYTLEIPNTKDVAYIHNYEYVTISANTENKKDVVYKKMNINTLASDTEISLRGLADWEFAKITMDLENKSLKVVSNNMQPHSYFPGTEYANIKILDKNGTKVYEHSYIGDAKTPSNDKIDIDLGYKIVLTHQEPGRLKFTSKLLGEEESFKNLDKNPTTYTITKYGLQKEGTTDEAQYELYKTKTDKYEKKLEANIPQNKKQNKYNYFIQKNNLLSNILELNDADKAQYLEKNNILTNGSSPKVSDIAQLEFNVGDTLNIDLSKIKVTDVEDGNILLNEKNSKLTYDVAVDKNNKITKEGTYNAKLTVSDLDNNEVTKEFKILVKTAEVENSSENQKPTDTTKPNDTQKPVEETNSSETTKPVEESKPTTEEQQTATVSDTSENKNSDSKNPITSGVNNILVDKTIKDGVLPKTGKEPSSVAPVIIFVIATLGFAIIKYVKSTGK